MKYFWQGKVAQQLYVVFLVIFNKEKLFKEIFKSNSLVKNIWERDIRDLKKHNTAEAAWRWVPGDPSAIFWRPVFLEKCQKVQISCILLFPC